MPPRTYDVYPHFVTNRQNSRLPDGTPQLSDENERIISGLLSFGIPPEDLWKHDLFKRIVSTTVLNGNKIKFIQDELNRIYRPMNVYFKVGFDHGNVVATYPDCPSADCAVNAYDNTAINDDGISEYVAYNVSSNNGVFKFPDNFDHNNKNSTDDLFGVMNSLVPGAYQTISYISLLDFSLDPVKDPNTNNNRIRVATSSGIFDDFKGSVLTIVNTVNGITTKLAEIAIVANVPGTSAIDGIFTDTNGIFIDANSNDKMFIIPAGGIFTIPGSGTSVLSASINDEERFTRLRPAPQEKRKLHIFFVKGITASNPNTKDDSIFGKAIQNYSYIFVPEKILNENNRDLKKQLIAHEIGHTLHMHHNHEENFTSKMIDTHRTDTDFWDGSSLMHWHHDNSRLHIGTPSWKELNSEYNCYEDNSCR